MLLQEGLLMCASVTKSGPSGADTGEMSPCEGATYVEFLKLLPYASLPAQQYCTCIYWWIMTLWAKPEWV